MSVLPPGSMRATTVSRRISPDRPLALGASDAGAFRWEGVESDLEVNVLALWLESDAPSMLVVTLDLLYPGTVLRAAVETAAAPLAAERIIVAASHTHRAPMTDDTKPALGSPDPVYMSWLTDEVSSAVRDALRERPSAVTLSVGETNAHHSINRRLRKRIVVARRPRINHFVNAPNPDGATDERLTTLVVRDESERPVAILWNYACHPVGSPVRNAISGHFPSHVREKLRAATGSHRLPVLFLQGFSGNVRPNASAEVHSRRRRLRQLVTGRLFEDMTWPSYRRWCESLAEIVHETVVTSAPVLVTRLEGSRVTAPSEKFAVGAGKPEMSFSRLTIGDSLSLYAVSGEVVVEYATRLRERDPARYVMCVGCTDQVIGYLPTEEVLNEGGYEAGGYCASFDLERVAPGVDAAMMDAFVAVGLPESAPLLDGQSLQAHELRDPKRGDR